MMAGEKDISGVDKVAFQDAFNSLNGKMESLLTEVMEIKNFVNNGDSEQLLQRIDKFDTAMRAAKGTQEILAAQITKILASQEELARKTMQRFDSYDKACAAIKETQKQLFDDVKSIAAKVDKLS